MRVLLLLHAAVAVVVVLGALPPVAGAARRPAQRLQWQRHEVAVAGPIGDGRSIVAWQAADGTVHTMGAGGAERRFGVPAGCARGTLAAAGATAVLLRCPEIVRDDGGDTYVLREVATGRTRRVLGPAAPVGGGGWTPTTMGAVWIAGEVTGPASAYTSYVPHRAGVGPARGRRAVDAPDLDARVLWRRMCAGIRAHRWPRPAHGTTDRFLPAFADGRLVATADRRRHWTLRRCRSRGHAPEALRGITEPPVLGGGLATWAPSPSVLSVLGSDGRRRRIRTPFEAAQLAARAGRVVAVADGAGRVWTGWLPRPARTAAAARASRVEHPRWRVRGTAVNPPTGDSRTIVAWQDRSGAVHALTADGVEHEPPAPEGCAQALRAAGGGAVLFGCGASGPGDSGDRYAIVDVVSGAVAHVVGPRPGGGGGVWDPYAMGAVWIAGWVAGYKEDFADYVRRDGAPGVDRPRRRTEVDDLDADRLWRRLCDGLRVAVVPPEEMEDGTWPFFPAGTDGTFAATMDHHRRWALHRCGRRGAIGIPAAPSFGAVLVAWSAGRTRIGVLQRDGRRRRLAKPAVTGTGTGPALVGRVMVLATPVHGGFRIWTASLRRR